MENIKANPNDSYKALHQRINEATETLYERFSKILELTPLTLPPNEDQDRPDQLEKKDKILAMTEAYEMETHASAMIRAADDLLALTKSLKEAWIFGQIGGDEKVVEEIRAETNKDAREVGEAMRRIATKEVAGPDV